MPCLGRVAGGGDTDDYWIPALAPSLGTFTQLPSPAHALTLIYPVIPLCANTFGLGNWAHAPTHTASSRLSCVYIHTACRSHTHTDRHT